MILYKTYFITIIIPRLIKFTNITFFHIIIMIRWLYFTSIFSLLYKFSSLIIQHSFLSYQISSWSSIFICLLSFRNHISIISLMCHIIRIIFFCFFLAIRTNNWRTNIAAWNTWKRTRTSIIIHQIRMHFKFFIFSKYFSFNKNKINIYLK